MVTAMEVEEVRAVFMSVVECEERVKLMKAMLRSGVGFPEVEHFFRKQSQHCRVERHKQQRNDFQINFSMKYKFKDAVAHLESLKKIKSKTRRRILEEKGSRAKAIIRGIEAYCRGQRKLLKVKNERKLQHLVRKFRPDCNKRPSKILKYSRAAVFRSDEGEHLSNIPQPAPLVYGDVSIDEDEKEALSMDPKFAVLNKLSDDDFEVEVELCVTKQKWNRMSAVNNCEDEKEREEMELADAMSREVFEPVEKVFNMQKRRVTDLAHNAYIILPPAQPIEYESLLELRRQKQSEVFRQYREEHCDGQGRQKANITRQQAEGLKKLKKRSDEGEIVVCATDKSGRLCVMPMEMYQELGRVHTVKDTEVDDQFVSDTQRRLNGHVSMWIKCLDMGADWKHQDRLRETQINKSQCVAPFYLLVKDHKSGPLSTRPVCGAVNGMDVHLSNILSPIIETVADEMRNKDEVISTDDALSRIDSFNGKQSRATHCRDLFVTENSPSDAPEFTFSDVLDEILGDDWGKGSAVRAAEYNTDEEEFTAEEEVDKLHEARERQTEEIIVAGSDIISLFPSITVEQAEKLCYEALLETQLSFEGVNYEELAL